MSTEWLRRAHTLRHQVQDNLYTLDTSITPAQVLGSYIIHVHDTHGLYIYVFIVNIEFCPLRYILLSVRFIL